MIRRVVHRTPSPPKRPLDLDAPAHLLDGAAKVDLDRPAARILEDRDLLAAVDQSLDGDGHIGGEPGGDALQAAERRAIEGAGCLHRNSPATGSAI